MTTPISQHHGGASVGALAGGEREVEDYRRQKSLTALHTQPPQRDLSSTARVFRMPRHTSYTLVDEIKRRVTDMQGNEITPQIDVRVMFTRCDVAPEHCEVVLDPVAKNSDDEARAKADADRLRVLQRFMEGAGRHLGIFDFLAERAAAQRAADAALAAELAKPGMLDRVREAARSLGIAIDPGMKEAAAPPAPKGAVPLSGRKEA